ncbi:MAG TPA: AsmA family protein [Bryobacteraceae bacterium]|nr:AsmA family protein [Bryobacteraceae bacterium]
MGRILKWVGIALAVLLVAALSLPFLINVEQFKPMLESRLSTALNRQVKLGHLKLSLLAGEVSADDLFISEDEAFGKPAFIRAKSLAVGAQVWPFLISRKLIVTYLTIDRPEIALVQAPSGNWNFSSLGAKTQASAAAPAPGTAPLDLSVQRVKITNGQLTLRRTLGHWKPLVLNNVNLDLQNFSASTAFPLTLSASIAGGGTILLNGTAGPINPTDSAMTPVNATLKIDQLDLAGSGMNDFAPDLAGLVSFEGSGTSDGRTMQATGRLKADKMKLAHKGTPASRAVEFDFAAEHDLRSHKGGLRRGDIHIGNAVAHLTGTYAEQSESMVLNMTLSGPSMPVSELEAMLPALGVVLPSGSRLEGGTATVMLTMQGPADKLVTSGSLALNNSKLAGFDLPKRMATVEKLAGIKGGPDAEIQTFSADVRVAPEGASAQAIKLIMPAIGDLSGGGTVSAANDLDFRMSATVHASGLLAVAGNTAIPFTVQGTCSDPVFRPDLKSVVKEELKGVVEGNLKKDAGGLLKGLLGGKKQ